MHAEASVKCYDHREDLGILSKMLTIHTCVNHALTTFVPFILSVFNSFV